MSKKTNYIDTLNAETRNYFNILCSDFPEWLFEYIKTPEMQRIDGISISCGTDYSNCFNIDYFYSNLSHSVGVALIIWNFTHDKTQTLAGLFHDISTPVFKHCIDFMNGDSEKQESIEDGTVDFISKSLEIMNLLTRDGIKLEDVCDYKKYPIADNDTPQLSADRLEYTFSSGLTFCRVWNLELIKEIYDNLIVSLNEDNIPELTFKSKSICEKYIQFAYKLWPEWISDKDRIVMQFLADTCSQMHKGGYLSIDDLYTYSEQEIIERILTCPDRNIADNFKKFQEADRVLTSAGYVDGKYCVKIKAKQRYVNPLVNSTDTIKRISDISLTAKKCIDTFLLIDQNNYIYFDFEYKI